MSRFLSHPFDAAPGNPGMSPFALAVIVLAFIPAGLTDLCSAAEQATATESNPEDIQSGKGPNEEAQVQPEFNRDIRPILSNACFHCHGPDRQARKGGLRLDLREFSTEPAESGSRAIVPGHPENSMLMERIHSTDVNTVMPPPDSGKVLTAAQKQVLEEWIRSGAGYQQHWSYLPIQRPEVPQPVARDWGRNEIDQFVLARMEQENLHPSREADVNTVIRRLSLDLTGLPPSSKLQEEFFSEFQQSSAVTPDGKAAEESIRSNADAPRAGVDAVYERLMDRLLKSPHYGERMAVDWLDAARFADTNGYQVDRDREMYAWRDWVIEAFNTNMPFDQFTMEQLAGDLLTEPTLAQKIATGFHRNHMMNEEGGVIPEEFLAEYCADRVETTATIWLGQTLMCARCHDHKFDPFTQRDYYGLFAFFHNISESGIGNYGAHYRMSAPPVIRLPAPELEKQIADLKAELAMLQASATTQVSVSAETGQPLPVADNKQASEERQKKIPELIRQLEEQIPTTLVMAELPQPRVTRILMRGAYDKPGEEVTAATPEILPSMSSELPRNRLGLARWLTDPSNPLPARVTMNRLWQSFFGVGLVRTSEDFGTQGAAPSHPELLDWLADEFIRSGWDFQHMIRLIVTSSTYRQSSARDAALQERDSENQWLSRGARFRLQSEFLRDQALFVSGLLSPRIGGPSVKPYHPPGLYEQVTAGSGTNTYVEDKGENLYRRSMYTYWKRSVPNPSMLVFDAPFRESCTMRRTRTNTPLQALNLMNDPTYVEAARFLAQRMLVEGGTAAESQLQFGFQVVLTRKPTSSEESVLLKAYHRALQDFRSDPTAADELLKVGATPSAEHSDRQHLAAMTIVAGTLLNLDETLTRE